jgi:hypothetical protein
MPRTVRIVEKSPRPKDLNGAIKNWKSKSREFTDDLKNRKEFKKPSVDRRERINRAKYIQKIKDSKR